MAKGGSLLGKADTTLTGMSYKQAMADVTPDLGQVYKDEVLTQALFEKGVKDHFDTLYADNNALADELKEATKKAMTGLGTDYEAMELFNSHLTSMKDRMKALPKGKKGDFERAKIRAELAQLQKSSADLDNTVTKLGTMISAGDFNEHATGSNNMSLYKSIADGTAKKEIVDGNLIYSIPNPLGGEDIKMDRQALEDALVQKDPEFQSNFNKIYAGENARGKQKGTTFDRQGAINDYEASFPSPAAFAANIHEKQGSLKYSFADALKYNKDGSDSIYKALMELDPATVKQYDQSGPDGEPDGKITNADFANKESGIALIESLTDIHSDNFNYQAAKKAAAEFYADNISEKEFNDGVAMRPKETKNTKETDIGGIGGYENSGFDYRTETNGDPKAGIEGITEVSYSQKSARRSALKNFETVPGAHYEYRFELDNKTKKETWKAYNKIDDSFVRNMDGAEIARIEGLKALQDSSYSGFNIDKVIKDKEEQERQTASIPGGVTQKLLSSTLPSAERFINAFDEAFLDDYTVLNSLNEDKSKARDKLILVNNKTNKQTVITIGPSATAKDAAGVNELLSDYIMSGEEPE